MVQRCLASADSPVHVRGGSELAFDIDSNGFVFKISHRDIMINLFLGSALEGSPANIYLRLLGEEGCAVPLLGPRSPSSFSLEGGFSVSGRVYGIEYFIRLVLPSHVNAWFWKVILKNIASSPLTLELVYTQDLGLAHYGAIRTNEFYTSHYIDHTPLYHERKGVVVASRQNLPMDGRHPWAMLGSLRKAAGYATDALQIYGLDGRKGLFAPILKEDLPSLRLQQEHSLVAIQDSPVTIEKGKEEEAGFFGLFLPDHPDASCIDDLRHVGECVEALDKSREFDSEGFEWRNPSPSLFSHAPGLEALDLAAEDISILFPGERLEEERKDGRLLSFFTHEGRHVVLREKELSVLRPHAHILRTGGLMVPDEQALTSTAWMSGVFNSMTTQGHVAINRFISTVHSYLGIFRSNGQRIFVKLSEGWTLLGVPSAFEMSTNSCRWIYRHNKGIIEVVSDASLDRHYLRLVVNIHSGEPLTFLISHHVAIDGDDGSSVGAVTYRNERNYVLVFPRPGSEVGSRFPKGRFRLTPSKETKIEKVGGDEMLFSDGVSRNQPFLCLLTKPSLSLAITIEGGLVNADLPKRAVSTLRTASIYKAPRLYLPQTSESFRQASRLCLIMPWFIHNSLIHYLAPRGTEQYTGGGWGTRDICQGTVELFLGLGRIETVREILLKVFEAQNPDGDWPQWFMFFDRERNIRAGDSHGDIVFWPLAALATYLSYSGDADVLHEKVPFFHPDGVGKAEEAEIIKHVDRALSVISGRMIPGTALAAYGHGDWNDSMQPFDPAMRENLCSAWTVTLHYQTLRAMAMAFDSLGMKERARVLFDWAEKVKDDFRRLLLVEGVVAGFAHFKTEGRMEYLLHPRDKTTGVSFRLLPMIHAIINDLLTKDEAESHLELIRDNLLGPDGARLFDRPMEYRGGVMKKFLRAESAAYFGREIGLMYTHAHLRYAEALARYGDSEGFFKALCQANPIGIREIVPTAAPRQSNCYYSSSDASFRDRYDAARNYHKVKEGEIALEGGWRIYSSGPGIWTRLFIQHFLGIKVENSRLVLDPVVPVSLDGLKAELSISDLNLEITYRIGRKGAGPTAVEAAGSKLAFKRAPNPYRQGAAEVSMEDLCGGGERRLIRLTVWLK